jgi:hypothetical protein
MSGSIVQASAIVFDDTGGTVASISQTITVTAGNHIVAQVNFADTGTGTCSVSDGTAYTVSDSKRRHVGQNESSQIFHLPNAGGGSHTVTATFSPSAAFPRLRLYEVSGLVSSSSVDQSAGQPQNTPGTGANALTSGNTAATTNANDFLMGFMSNVGEASPGSGTVTAGTSFTLIDGNVLLTAEGRSVSATGTYAATFTRSVSVDCVTQIVAFKESVPPSPFIFVETEQLPPHYFQVYPAMLLDTDIPNLTAVLIQHTRGRISFTEFEVPQIATRGRISFVEIEVPNIPTRGRTSFAELQVPTVPTRGRISFAEVEVPLIPTRGRLSFTELEIPFVKTRGRISFTELQVPSVGAVAVTVGNLPLMR